MEGILKNISVSKFLLIIIIFALQLVSPNTIAGERFEFFNGIRSLGMGGVSAAVVNDETALIANPAALGKLRNYFVTVFDPEVDLGADTQRIIDADILAFKDPQATLDAAKLFPGRKFHQRAQIFPSFVVTNFGMGFYGRYATDAQVDATGATYQYDYREDLAFVFGFNFRIFDGRIKLGVNARATNRIESHRSDIPVAATGLDFEAIQGAETLAREGFGVATDAGLILTGPWKFLPTLAFVYKDIGTTSYTLNDGMFLTTTNRPERTPATLDAGIGIFPILGKNTRFSFSAEYMDVLDALEPAELEESDEVMRRIHYGFEFNFYDTFFLRGGMNQGYWTAGVEISMFNTQLQLASYGEEVGDVVPAGSALTYTKVEDRRYVAKFAYRF
jgi:hypothetical protein